MPLAARLTDTVSHPTPPILTGGPGSLTVSINGLPAWRALPAALGATVQAAALAGKALMDAPLLNPTLATPMLAAMDSTLRTAAQAAATNNPTAPAIAATALVTVQTSNVLLTTAWTTASALPGGQPAADEAYSEGIRALAATAATTIFNALGSGFDIHVCGTPLPPHGPGLVTIGSTTVSVDGLPLARQGDQLFEAVGGANPITGGAPTVSAGG